jgi:hypothetical protein
MSKKRSVGAAWRADCSGIRLPDRAHIGAHPPGPKTAQYGTSASGHQLRNNTALARRARPIVLPVANGLVEPDAELFRSPSTQLSLNIRRDQLQSRDLDGLTGC